MASATVVKPKYDDTFDKEKADEDDDERSNRSSSSWQHWRKQQVLPALLLCAVGFAQLTCVLMIGPSLLDLQLQTSSSLALVSWLLSARALGATLGTVVLGYFIDRGSLWLQLAVTTCWGAVFFGYAPWSESIWVQLALITLVGFSGAYVMTGANIGCYKLFPDQKDSVSWLNVYQLSILMGGIAAPLIVQPFLVTQPRELNATTNVPLHSGVSPSDAIFDLAFVGDLDAASFPVPDDTRVMYGFLIGASLVFFIGVLMFMLRLFIGVISFKHGDATSGRAHRQGNRCLKMAIVCILGLFYFLQSEFVRSYNNFLLAFSVNHLHWSKTDGTMLTSSYFIASVVIKFVNIFTVRFMSLEVLIFSGLLLSTSASMSLVFLVERHYVVIWLGSIVLAIGTSITMSAMFAWTDKYIGIKGHIAILSGLCGNIGEIVYPGLIGFILDRVAYMALMYLTATCTIACLLLMLLLQYLGMQYRKSMATDAETEPLLGNEKQPLLDNKELVVSNEKQPLLDNKELVVSNEKDPLLSSV